jgi:CHRD domain
MSRRSLAGLAAAVVSIAGIAAGATLATGQTSVGNRALFGELNGANEIAQDGTEAAGDRNGRGTASAIVDGRRLCYGLTVKNIDETAAAHIHRGAEGVNGPIVVTLEPPEDGGAGAASGCVNIRRSLARDILRRPQRYYWNVHTGAFRDGAIRGQVFETGD